MQQTSAISSQIADATTAASLTLTDGGAGETSTTVAHGLQARSPLRTCIATAQTRPKHELLRFVLSPDGVVTFDVNGRLPGRGLWITPSAEAFAIATKKNAFSRAAKTQVSVPSILVDHVVMALKTGILRVLGLARRRGDLILGTAKVEAALAAGTITAVWIAEDTSAMTAEQWVRKCSGGPKQVPYFQAFTQTELAIALGRATVAIMGLAVSKPSGVSPFVAEHATEIPVLGGRFDAVRHQLQYLFNLSHSRQGGVVSMSTDPHQHQES